MTIKQNEKFIRQPALRLFAAELAESKQTIIEHFEGRDFDSLYQLTPTGVKVKRVLMMGVLVEIENNESGDYLRGRIIDPTGAFTVYAGQYQPEALRALSSFTIPCFVAVVGKTNAYRQDEKTTIVSIRPENIVEIDAITRDYWVKETVSKTLERVERSQLPEVDKEKYKQICRNALTKLIYMPQETSIHIQEFSKESTPHQDYIPDKLTIEQSTTKEELPDDTELKEKILSPTIEDSSKLPKKVEEPTDKTLAISRISNVEEQPKPENEISENLQLKESKESKIKRNSPVKGRKRKKKIDYTPMKNQKALFPQAFEEHV